MNWSEKRVSLKFQHPRLSLGATALVIFILTCLLAEIVARAPFVQAQIPYQAYGINHTQLELQLNLLNKYAREKGAPDCFIFGSSQAFRETDPAAFERSYETVSGEKVNCYNFGVTGSQIWSTSLLSEILIRKYQPRLVVIGTSFLDYTEGREQDINERYLKNDWLRYQTGAFNLNGWLTEHSYAWRALTILSYAAPYGMRYGEVVRGARKWDGEIADNGFALSDVSVNPSLPVETGFVKNLQKEFGDFGVSERNLDALEHLISFSQQAGAQVLIAEMTYHPALLELKDRHGQPRADKARILAFIDKVNARLRDIAKNHGVPFLEAESSVSIPDTGWYDLYHLNRVGAEVFSEWLGGQAARLLGPLPTRSSSEGN
ncbi:MAG: hypothetical protein PGMFKBFP_00261 [Anaerolineales bacterium]|nr:hypothetical protein [Anaerolineales bacterium]